MTTQTAIWSRWWPWAAEAGEADWEALYADQMPKVYNFFRYRVGAGPEAEDLTSITFEKAWRARHRYRRDLGAFSTWLFTIARRVAVDHHRARHDHRPLEEAAVVATGETAEDVAVHNSDVARLVRLLDGLAERERELIALKYGGGLTNRAIARLTGLSESNVGTLLYRTILNLRARWDKGAPA